MRLAVVGCEASGKTVFMAALSDHYRPETTNGLCLVPENSSTNRFSRMLVRQMRSLRQWPAATNPDKTVELEWSLRSGDDVIADIDMLEFGGETLRAVFRGEGGERIRRQSEKELLGYLAAADSIVVLVSIKELMRDPGSVSAEEFERDTESMWVTRGLLDFAREKLPGAGVVIGLTQADRYRGELAAAGGAGRLFASRWPTIASVAHSIPVVEVASVSATDENGNPAEGYSTEGVLPVMRELARQSYGDKAEIKAGLASILESPMSTASKARKYGAKLTALSRHAALSGEDERDFIKEAQAKLEGKINEMKAILAEAKIIDTKRLSTDAVQILSKVEMTNLATKAKMTYTIVSENEANLREGKIAITTPIAQGLLNHKVGDEVEITIPRGKIKLRIDKISI